MGTKNKPETILAIDVGEKRIGVARAHLDAPFPQPLTTLEHPGSFIEDILALCAAEKAGGLVVGLPRNLNGEDTAQTAYVRLFVSELEDRLSIPLYWIDEALTSRKAEAELAGRGRPYAKGEVDALAATYMLEDFVTNHKRQILELHDA